MIFTQEALAIGSDSGAVMLELHGDALQKKRGKAKNGKKRTLRVCQASVVQTMLAREEGSSVVVWPSASMEKRLARLYCANQGRRLSTQSLPLCWEHPRMHPQSSKRGGKNTTWSGDLSSQ
eukprot:354680-Amphidinium_carterae.2